MLQVTECVDFHLKTVKLNPRGLKEGSMSPDALVLLKGMTYSV